MRSRATVEEVADYLGVSPEFVLGLLSTKAIWAMMTGPKVLVVAEDVVRWKHEDDRRRDEALDELARLGQEMGEYDA